MIWTWVLTSSTIFFHVAALYELAWLRSGQQPYNNPSGKAADSRHGITRARLLGVMSTALAIYLPYTMPEVDPLTQALIRNMCAFYSLKILDLVFIQADPPPTRVDASTKKPTPMQTFRDKSAYVWTLLTEMRYRSFDIYVIQKGRQFPQAYNYSGFSVMPLIGIPAVTYLFPLAPFKAACLLLFLWVALEGLHLIMHPFCPWPEFYQPFSAATSGEFWATHWHAGAYSWQQGLLYKPVRRLTGSPAAGILAVFAVTGVWHGWAAAPTSEKPWSLGMQGFGLFILFGVSCIAERLIWQNQRGISQRISVWTFALLAAGFCFNTLECYSTIPLLKDSRSCNRWLL